MLSVTDRAALAIRRITSGPEVPVGAGLRIAGSGTPSELRLTIAASPREGDDVIHAAGAVLFVDQAASEVLDGQALDARVGDDGEPQFTVARLPGA